jgi:hypothetical protein
VNDGQLFLVEVVTERSEGGVQTVSTIQLKDSALATIREKELGTKSREVAISQRLDGHQSVHGPSLEECD